MRDSSLFAGFYTVAPLRTRESGQRLLDVLTTQGGVYIPEKCEVWVRKETFEWREFTPETIKLVLDEWEGLHGPTKTLNLIRVRPTKVQFIAELRDWSNFDTFNLSVDLSYFDDPMRLSDFTRVSKELFDVLNPCYGDLSSWEMHRKVREGKLEYSPGTSLTKSGLPDVYWGNFYGPEYVELFGKERIMSAPFHHVQEMSNGGVLAILTESPFDFDNDSSAFNQARDAVKAYLGEEAFYRSEKNRATRFPNFRFWAEREALRNQFRTKHSKFFTRS